MHSESHRKHKPIHFLHNPTPESLAEDSEQFLHQLGGPTLITVDGRDNSRCRVIATLLHGNEPSGTKALLAWLRSGEKPAVRTLCLIASVQAALHETPFYHRMIPGQRDMNRCFRPPFEDHQGHIAEQFMGILEQCRPEAVLDIHNTSGMSPSFGVATFESEKHEALVKLFTDRLIITELRLGALMELSREQYPVVTIECGGSHQPESEETAMRGLQEFLFCDQVFHRGTGEIDLYRHAVRIELIEGTHIAYADQPVPGADLTIPFDVEKFNFGVIPALTRLGWLGPRGLDVLRVNSAKGDDLLPHYLMARHEGLYSAQRLKLFMVTTNPAIALSDCLFYACAETEHSKAKLTE